MPSFILKVCALAYVAALATVPAYAAPTHEQDGAALFEANCLKCHGGKVAKAPPMSLLQIMSASSVLRAMEHGIMQEQAAALNGDQRRLVAEYLTGQKLGAGSAAPPAPQAAHQTARRR